MTHSQVVTEFGETLRTNFFNRLRQQPNWRTSEIEAEFLQTMVEALNITITSIVKEYNDMIKSEGGKFFMLPPFNTNLES